MCYICGKCGNHVENDEPCPKCFIPISSIPKIKADAIREYGEHLCRVQDRLTPEEFANLIEKQ